MSLSVVVKTISLMRLVRAIPFAIGFVLLFSACMQSFFSAFEMPPMTEALRIVLPSVSVPDDVFEGLSFENAYWLIRYFDGVDSIRTLTMPFAFDEGEREIVCIVPRGLFTPFVAEVVFPSVCRIPLGLLTFGALYPVHEEKIRLHMLQSRGFLADTAWKLLTLSDICYDDKITYLSHFNWLKCEAHVAHFENHWDLNQELLIQAIAQRKVSVYSFKEK